MSGSSPEANLIKNCLQVDIIYRPRRGSREGRAKSDCAILRPWNILHLYAQSGFGVKYQTPGCSNYLTGTFRHVSNIPTLLSIRGV